MMGKWRNIMDAAMFILFLVFVVTLFKLVWGCECAVTDILSHGNG